MDHNQEDDNTLTAPFHITSKDLTALANERSPAALADLLEGYARISDCHGKHHQEKFRTLHIC